MAKGIGSISRAFRRALNFRGLKGLEHGDKLMHITNRNNHQFSWVKLLVEI